MPQNGAQRKGGNRHWRDEEREQRAFAVGAAVAWRTEDESGGRDGEEAGLDGYSDTELCDEANEQQPTEERENSGHGRTPLRQLRICASQCNVGRSARIGACADYGSVPARTRPTLVGD